MNLNEIQHLCYLYKEHGSLRKVSKISGISVNTIDKYISKLVKINRKTIVKNLKSNDDLLIGIFIGLWAGDGSRYYDKGYITKIHYHKQNPFLKKFIQQIVKKLFAKEVRQYLDGKNRASIKIHSKFIYYFPEKYLLFNSNKTLSIQLKKSLDNYTEEFMDGFLLGLMLSDGSIKRRFCFTSISKALISNVSEILFNKGFSPKSIISDRTKYGWYDLRQIYLNSKESKQAIFFLNNISERANWFEGIEKLKIA